MFRSSPHTHVQPRVQEITIMRTAVALFAALGVAACASTPPPAAPEPAPDAERVAAGAFDSRYQPFPSTPTLIRGGTVMTAAGEVIEGGDVLLVDGRVAAVGRNLEAPAGARTIDAAGRFVTPGIIDTHSHLGVYASPGDQAHADGNEMTRPVTGHVYAEHAVWPQDPGFPRALAGGITSLHILPGSANLIGGRGVTLRNVPARTMQAMRFPGAPHTLKMACGENPKRVYGSRNQAPMTRMANIALTREAWIRAGEYRDQVDRWENGDRTGNPPTRNLELETLADVLRGRILIQNHCYRADEIANRLEIAREFGYSIRSIHHGVEAYKVADMLAEEGVGVSIWADWWGFKLEALDATNANAALTHQAGVTTVIHSDDAIGIQILNQEAAKALAAGREAGIDISDDEALRWITANAAWTLGIEDEVGTLEEGKRGDVVIWSAHPFSVYARADQVFVDGALLHDRTDPARNPITDFELGIFSGEGN
jgi:imidazolonepropionase-like amidohydrolase